jgi:hypothetical protein
MVQTEVSLISSVAWHSWWGNFMRTIIKWNKNEKKTFQLKSHEYWITLEILSTHCISSVEETEETELKTGYYSWRLANIEN